MYSIGEISAMFNMPISTLRYYDKKGLFLNIERNSSGIRRFGQKEIETLNVIECLKKAGMSLDDIKLFMDWCQQGDKTLAQRKEMFYQRKKEVEVQLQELQKVADFINYKCWYYDTACNEKTENRVKNIKANDMPDNIRILYENTH